MISESLKEQVMEDIVLLTLVGVKVVLVHGGGPEMNDAMKKMGKEPVFDNGLRVTDHETMEIAQMVLAGKINKTLVNLLQMKGGRKIHIYHSYIGASISHACNNRILPDINSVI